MRTATARTLLWGTLSALGAGLGVATLFVQACGHPARGPGAASVDPSLAASPAPATEAPKPVYRADLQAYRPLLSLPELHSAKVAYDTGDPELASMRVARVVRKQAGEPLATPHWALLIGRLSEEGGALDAAREAYAKAAGVAWPLQPYAQLGLGRTLRELEDNVEAEAVLREVAPDTQAFGPAQALLARIACEGGRAGECLDRVESFMAEPVRHRGWEVDAFEALAYGVLPELGASASPSGQGKAPPSDQEPLRVLSLLRRLQVDAPNTSHRFHADELVERVVGSLSAAAAAARGKPSRDHLLLRLRSEVDSRKGNAAAETATRLLERLEGLPAADETRCEATYLKAKALTLGGHRRGAEQLYKTVAQECEARDQQAWSLFVLGKQAYKRGDYDASEALFRRLEAVAPTHRLADDARLYRAQGGRELGNRRRFSRLLTAIANDYPNGDMTPDGLFLLALSYIEHGQWAEALPSLQAGVELAGATDFERGPSHSGRERYFLARALMGVGQREAGLDELARIVEHLPLSYYALHAFSRLQAESPERARRVLERALARSKEAPFALQPRPEYGLPAFTRALELTRQGQFAEARSELARLGMFKQDADPQLLWTTALLYAQSDRTPRSHRIVRFKLSEWLGKWPVGTWETPWRLSYPKPYADTVRREARDQDLDPALVYGIMREESAFNPTVVSPANAFGLMQLIRPTARHYGRAAGLPYSVRALKDPEINIALGCRVLSGFGRHFRQNPLLVVPGYNAGPGRPRRWARERPGMDFDIWVELIPFRETRGYTKRVLASRATYAFLEASEGQRHTALQLPLKLRTEAN